MNISDTKKELLKKQGEISSLEKFIEETSIKIKGTKRKIKNLEDAGMILKIVAQKTQEELQYKISEIVTLALNSVFEENWEFNIDFVFKRGKTEAEIYLLRDNEKYDPMTDMGGGIVDVVSFALRIVSYIIRTPKTRNTIILDEPFRFLSKDLQKKASTMLRELSTRLNIQFIMVTHESELMEIADKTFMISQKKGISKVTEVGNQNV